MGTLRIRRPNRRLTAAAAFTALVAGAVAIVPVDAAGAARGSGAPRAVSAGTLSAFPMPGTRTAAPETGISFRGGSEADIGTVEVSGSRSGRHSGHLVAHPDGEGASFVPDEAFEPGEVVRVRTEGTVRRAKGGVFRFTIARPYRVPRQPAPAAAPTGTPAALGVREPARPAPAGDHRRDTPEDRGVRLRVPDARRTGDAAGHPHRGRRRPARVVQPDRWRARPPGADVARSAGAHLLRRPGPHARRRCRRLRDRGRELQPGRDRPCGQRVQGRPPRVHADSLGKRGLPGVQPGALRHPGRRGRRASEAGVRRHRPGGRRRHWSRALRMAQPRQRRADRVVPGTAREGLDPPVRLRAPELRRTRRRRSLPRLRSPHVDRLQDRPHDRCHRMAAGREEVRLQGQQGGRDGLAAPRPAQSRRDGDDLRQRGEQPAEDARRVARARRPARREGPHREAREGVSGPGQAPGHEPGQLRGAAQRQLLRRMGFGTRLHRVRPGRVDRLPGAPAGDLA